MTLSKRICTYLTALVVLSTSVFLFGGTAHAETHSMDETDKIIQIKSQDVAEKSDVVEDASFSIEQLIAKKSALEQQLANEQKTIDDLNQKLADKKAAAEAEAARVRALQAMFVHVNRYAGDSSGNLYSRGYCTWYVKNKRPDASNSWGNANTWYSRAAADGWSVGSAPKKGAIGTTTRGAAGHVVYVEGVSVDGQTVTISEMNYAGLYSLRTRTTNASEFRYIYELN